MPREGDADCRDQRGRDPTKTPPCVCLILVLLVVHSDLSTIESRAGFEHRLGSLHTFEVHGDDATNIYLCPRLRAQCSVSRFPECSKPLGPPRGPPTTDATRHFLRLHGTDPKTKCIDPSTRSSEWHLFIKMMCIQRPAHNHSIWVGRACSHNSVPIISPFVPRSCQRRPDGPLESTRTSNSHTRARARSSRPSSAAHAAHPHQC